MRVFQAIASVFCLFAVSLPAHGARAEEARTRYTLQPHETISAVARKFGTTVLAIKEANDLRDPDSVPDFTVLVIPGASSRDRGSDVPVMSDRRATTAGEDVNVRQRATTDSETVRTLGRGDQVTVTAEVGFWSHVALSDGHTGWIRSDLLEFAPKPRTRRVRSPRTRTARPSVTRRADSESVDEKSSGGLYPRAMPRPAPRNGFGEEIVRAAYGYRGTPYRYGGASKDGFDCSGFTSFLYGRKGVTLPHSARAQFATGHPVDQDNLKPGDLVFFHTVTPGISHVGVYAGGGKFVHASSRRQGEVRIDSLQSGYYHERFRGGRNFRR